jgi:hypothetical protein
MKVEPISVSGSYEYVNEYGLKRWKKISIGATVTQEDNVLDCLMQLDKQVEEAYKKIVPDVSIVAGEILLPEIQVQEQIKEKPLEQVIRECTTVEELKNNCFWPAQVSEELKFIYKAKLKKLNGG